MRAIRRGILLLGAAVVLSGCAAFSSTPPSHDGVRVAAGFYPLAYLAERIGGPGVVVTNLTQPGAEPHDLELNISQTVAVADADLVLHERGLQPAVDDAVENVATREVVDVADVVDLQPFADRRDQTDPHFWLDPGRMAVLAGVVATRLGQIDPTHAEEYAARGQALEEDLGDLTAAYDRGLRDCDQHTIVVSHDAFGYLARFGLHIEAIAGLSPGAEPTPADLARLQDLVRTDHITTVFSERLASPRLAQTLADDAGVRMAVLDPIEGLVSGGDDATDGEDYLSLMRENLQALREANQCR